MTDSKNATDNQNKNASSQHKSGSNKGFASMSQQKVEDIAKKGGEARQKQHGNESDVSQQGDRARSNQKSQNQGENDRNTNQSRQKSDEDTSSSNRSSSSTARNR